MKPLKLEMKNFGPYRDESIDFESLDDMFLITGPTGSGKTFIFDAMTFALYGESSGKRGEKSLKSTYAEIEEKSYVNFEFSMSGDVFRVNRTIPYDHVTKTGKITHKQSELDVFKKSGGNFIPLWPGENLSDVNKKLEKLIGLKADEFSMVVVLPQGEFAKFLRESSTERTKTLSKLFPVSLYSELMDSIKAKYEKSNKDLEAVVSAITSIGENVSSVEELECQIKKDEGEYKSLYEKTSGYDDTLQKLNVKIKVLETEYNEAIKYEKNLSRQKELKEREPEIHKIEDKIKLARKAASVYPFYEAQEKAFVRVAGLESEIEKLSQELKSLEADEKELDKSREEINQLKETIEGKKSNLAKLKSAWKLLSEINSIKETKKNLEINIQENEGQLNNLSGMLTEYEALKKKEELENLASTVAENLVEGQPCPVCGSVHHPLPCVKPESIVGLDDKIKTTKKSVDLFENALSKSRQELSGVESSLSIKEKDFTETGFSVPLPEYENEEENLRKNEKLIFDFDSKEEKLKNRRANISGKFEAKSDSLEEEKVNLETEKNNFQKKFSESGFTDIREMEDSYLNENQIASLEDEIRKWKDETTAVNTLLESSPVTKKSSEVLIQKEETVKEFHSKNTEYSELKETIQRINNNIIRNRQIFEKLESLEKDRSRIEKEVEPLKLLYEILFGSNPKKIKFDSWALGVYFNQVLSAASERFREISDKRYYFKLKEDISGGGKKGLDFVVCDTYNGTERDVETLSGGETFMASISLALAMTDFVGSRNCGLQMDSLFIDEGFGTLDVETQDLAMEILTRLKDGNKKIGIISHVENLQTRIGSKIKISKTTSGSHISQ